MADNLSEQTIYEYIVDDFETAWNAVYKISKDNQDNPQKGFGNFMFTRQAMTLLEFVSRLCVDRPDILKNVSNELWKIEPKYFTKLPGICCHSGDFDLPCRTSKGEELLCALFDLVRHGGAHQYQQTVAHLTDEKDWIIRLTGATVPLNSSAVSLNEHLGFYRDSVSKDLIMVLCPNVLFNHLKGAVEKSDLLKQGLSFPYLVRPKKRKPGTMKRKEDLFYQFSSTQLGEDLENNNHAKLCNTDTKMSGEPITFIKST